MYKSKNYVYQDKVKYDEEGVIFIPTVNLSNRAGGVKLTKGSGLVLHSMLVPMSEVGHEESLLTYSKEIRDRAADNYTSRNMQLYLSLNLYLTIQSFRPLATTGKYASSKIIRYSSLVPGLMPAITDSYVEDRYFLKADRKTWDKKKLFNAIGMLESKKMTMHARETMSVQEPYSYFTISPSTTKPATNLQFQLLTNKKDLSTTSSTLMESNIMTYYDVIVPPNVLEKTDWLKYNYGENIYAAWNLQDNPINMTMSDFIFKNIVGKVTMAALHGKFRITGVRAIHRWRVIGSALHLFCSPATEYRDKNKRTMRYNCFYVPTCYKDLITNSYMYKQHGSNIDLAIFTIDELVANTIGSQKSSQEVLRLLTAFAPERKHLLRVSYNRSINIMFDLNNKDLYSDYFIYYIGDPYQLNRAAVLTNEERTKALHKASRLGSVNKQRSSDKHFFSSSTHRSALIDLLNDGIQASIASNGGVENVSIDVSIGKKWLSWSWQRFQDISPSKPSLNHLIKPYFIYQNDCKRRIVTGKQEGYTIISSGQLDFSKPYTEIDSINYASMVVDCRVSGVIRDDVFSDEISFKVVDLIDRPPPAFIPSGKTEKLPFRSVLLAYTSSEMASTYRNVDALSFTCFPTNTDNKNDFSISTHNTTFEDFFAPYSLRKNMKFRFNLDNFTMPTMLDAKDADSFNTPRIFVCVKGLGDAQDLLVDGKQYRILGIINLSYEKRWKALKITDNHFAFSFSDDSLAAPNGQGPIDVANLGMSFITNNYSDLAAFNVYLLNSTMKPLQFGTTAKVPIINYTVTVMNTSV